MGISISDFWPEANEIAKQLLAMPLDQRQDELDHLSETEPAKYRIVQLAIRKLRPL